MTFPTYESTTETSDATQNDTGFTCNVPATTVSGDLLVMFLVIHEAEAMATGPVGWTQLEETTGFDPQTAFVYARVADGLEASTIDMTFTCCGAGCDGKAAHVLRFSDWFGTLATGVESAIGDDMSGTGTDPDPPSITPAWGALDTTWIACGGGIDDDVIFDDYPTNFDTAQEQANSGAGQDDGAEVATAIDDVNGLSLDPGAFTLNSSERIISFTVAIRPASKGIPALVYYNHRLRT